MIVRYISLVAFFLSFFFSFFLFFQHRQRKIPVAAKRRVHARHALVQIGQPVLRGSMYALHLRQFGDLMHQGDLSGAGMSQRTSDDRTWSMLSTVPAR